MFVKWLEAFSLEVICFEALTIPIFVLFQKLEMHILWHK